MLIRAEDIGYEKVERPLCTEHLRPVDLTDATMAERCQKVKEKMEDEAWDSLSE